VLIKNLSDASIYDAGRRYAGVGPAPVYTRKVRYEGHIEKRQGKMVEVRYPPMPFKKYVDKVGGVRCVTLSNAPGIRATQTPYAIQKMAFLESQGFIAYAECPLTGPGRQWLPESMQGRTDLCNPQDFGQGKKYGNHCGCPHIEEVIAIRHGDQERADAIRAEQAKTYESRKLEIEEKRNNAVFEQLALLTQAVKGGNPGTGDLLDQIAGNADMMSLLNQLANERKPNPDRGPDGKISGLNRSVEKGVPSVPEDDEDEQ